MSRKRVFESRRRFIKSSLGAAAGCAGGLLLPATPRLARAAGFAPLTNRVLVDVFMRGAPDWRHAFPPPYDANPNSFGGKYWQHRARSHGIASSESAYSQRWQDDYFHVADGDTAFGIRSTCGWLHRMWQQGNVAIVNNVVGSLSRDHAYSQRVMQRGNIDAPGSGPGSGWGGRLAYAGGGNVVSVTRSATNFCLGPDPSDATDLNRFSTANTISASAPREMELFASERGSWPTAVATNSLHDYYHLKSKDMSTDDPFRPFVEQYVKAREFGGQVGDRLREVPMPDSLASLDNNLSEDSLAQQARALYDAFAANDIFNLQVASFDYDGWDTHDQQHDEIEPMLEDLFGDGKAFDTLFSELPPDVKDNAVFLFYGEFGRQLKDNGGNGTDHGSGTAVVVVGNAVNGGVYGEMFPADEIDRIEDNSPDIEGRTELDHVFGEVCEWVSQGSKDFVFPANSGRIIEPGLDLGGLMVG